MNIREKIDMQNRLIESIKTKIFAADTQDLMRASLFEHLHGAMDELFYLEEIAEKEPDRAYNY
jgi:hypothetical protein